MKSEFMDLLCLKPEGLYCEAGDFYVDPWRPVKSAVITHAHSDHARNGSSDYFTATEGEELLKVRVPQYQSLTTSPFLMQFTINDARVSFHPAGHILGSCMVLIEAVGKRALITGDYKLGFDRSIGVKCEIPECDLFVTESTFGLPIYSWPDSDSVAKEINDWWRTNQERKVTSIITAYALGKAQRVLSMLDPAIGPIGIHGAVAPFLPLYRKSGINLPETIYINDESRLHFKKGGIIIAPPSVQATPWLRKLAPFSIAFASGWMQVRGIRRRRGVDRGFILSDHCDFEELNASVKASKARETWVTHGFTDAYSRFLNESGLKAMPLRTEYVGEMQRESEQ